MLDTFQISKTFARPPTQSELESKGWKPLLDKHTGDLTALYFNSAKGKGEPRLTLSQDRNGLWNIRAEVSLGSWLHHSNLYLPDKDELNYGLDLLSEYVETKSGIIFDAHTGRVSRVDFTRDFQVGENSVIPIIAKFAKLNLPRYKRSCFGETSVYFKNAGKERTKEFMIYSKYQERLAKGKSNAELEMAKGLLRLEVSFRKSEVNRLAKSLKLKSHQTDYILTQRTSEQVLRKAMKQLHFDSLLNDKPTNIENLFKVCGLVPALKCIGFLYVRDKYGENFPKLPFIDVSPKTLKRYFDDCKKAGVLSLE